MMARQSSAIGLTLLVAALSLDVSAVSPADTPDSQGPPGQSDGEIPGPRMDKSGIAQEDIDRRLAGLDRAMLDGDRPVVHVLSPPGSAASNGRGSESKILVVIEVIDVTGAGIDVNDSGLPRFVEPNHNVDVFSSYVARHQTYLNHLGQEVLQIVSEIPVDALRAGDMLMSPPIDYRRLSSAQKKNGFVIPHQAMLEAASFMFRVQDRQGAKSDDSSASARLVIGFWAGQSYLPPAMTPTMPGADQKP